MKRTRQTPNLNENTSALPADFDARRIRALHEEVAALLPAFEHAVKEEERLYELIHGLQEQIHAIEHRNDPSYRRAIYPELSGDPITITVRTGYLQKKIRFAIGDYKAMKRAGLYPYVSTISAIIGEELSRRGAEVTVDPHRAVSIVSEESRDERVAEWAQRLGAEE